MQQMSIEKTAIDGLFTITPFQSKDERGLFIKDYSKSFIEANGIDYPIKEIFYTHSKKGVLRGVHFQNVRFQPKIVSCMVGHIYDVVIDLRANSSTFKKWISFDLPAEEPLELLIPAGCGHSFFTFEDSIISYKCAEQFYSEYDSGIKWNDPDLNIIWPFKNFVPIQSKKDESLQSFKKFIKEYDKFDSEYKFHNMGDFIE